MQPTLCGELGGGDTMSRGWADEYENIVEFYFWEPQHLNRYRRADRPVLSSEAVLAALRKREVPLNHVLSIFLRLAPQELVARWFRLCDLQAIEPTLLRYSDLRKTPAFEACQPDLALSDIGAAIFCELKVDAKLTSDQIYKYALFHAASDRANDSLELLLVGRFANFPAASLFTSGGDLPPVSDKVRRHATNLGIGNDQLKNAAAAMTIRVTTYGDLCCFLSQELNRLDISREADQTLHRLLDGVVKHLRELGLAT